MSEPENSGLSRVEFETPDEQLDYRQVLLFVRALIHEVDPGLVIDPSLEFIVAGDYPTALAELSKTVGRDLRPTRAGGSEGVAMTVDVGDHDVIVIPTGLVELLFTSDMRIYLHTIHHELGHALDHALRRGRRQESQAEPLPLVRSQLFPIAEGIWSEYHAERRAAATWWGQSYHVPLLKGTLSSTDQEVRTLIAQHGRDRDTVAFLRGVFTRLDSLLSYTGYVLGELAGQGDDPGGLHPDLTATLAIPPLENVWQPLQQALGCLYATHGQWESTEVFIPLEHLVEGLMQRLGLVFEERPQGLFVRVLPGST